MKYKIDHDYHIHSLLSPCSQDPEQTPERLLQYAKEYHLQKICITDHFWDFDHMPCSGKFYVDPHIDLAHIKKSLPLPKVDGIEFAFGGETDLSQDLVLGIAKESMEDLDFLIIPTTHLHMSGFTINGDATPLDRAQAWISRLDFVLNQDLPFHKIGIAHLACHLIYHNHPLSEVLTNIPNEEYERLFTKAAQVGCGIELNSSDFHYENDTPESVEEVLRMFRIAKSCGCKFYLGSDAHHPKTFPLAMERFQRAIDALDLQETDKFYF